MQYNHKKIEKKWQKYWSDNQTFKTDNNADKPKYYVLDMFPYPSGAGLHVGHPLGYIASDIYARYKRHKGFNVLHPQGYDSFGLPAEQYAIQTGQHPAKTTAKNIATYRHQLDQIGFSFDWSREVRTSDPQYYKWTQWIFIQLFNSWYHKTTDKAEDIATLISLFEKEGNLTVDAACDDQVQNFTAADWKKFSDKEKQQILLQYRLAFLSDTEVNWCPALGTVLANDEIVNGVSERGGHPVVRKKMTQWSMRISAYAKRLLNGLHTIDWPQPLKDTQMNWIGRSQGAMITFEVQNSTAKISVFTTRPDTIFGASFMTLAPEHELVPKITTEAQKSVVEAYIQTTAKRSERERMADVKTISGVFTGTYAVHPFSGVKIPVWIGDYVLASYGTGAVMAVPCGDQRDYDFARHFKIDIPNIFKDVDISEEAFADKEKTIIANSDFLNGLSYKEATKTVIYELEKSGTGYGKTNYRLRDAVFSRQRYWGEPFPVYYVDGMPQMIADEHLPLVLPEVDNYLPTEDGQPPLGNATVWAWDTKTNTVVENEKIDHETVFPLELNTMPGWAGSSYYFNRYMDPHNENEIASREALDYWKQVDLYIGGAEHATGHLLYARFWQKFLFDKGCVPVDEFAKKLINQGMILGTSAFVHRLGIILATKGNPSKEDRDKVKKVKEKCKLVKEYAFSSDLIKYTTKLISNPINEDDKKHNEILNKIFGVIYNPIKKEIQELSIENYIEPMSMPLTFSHYKTHIDVSLVNASDELNVEKFKNELLNTDFKNTNFFSLDGTFKVSREVEKMSKSKYNVVNPDNICKEYGADSLRLFEMFLGPLEQSKPWKTSGISGAHSFLKKLWKLFYFSSEEGRESKLNISDVAPTKDELKILHKTIKKVEKDIEHFSFNTSVSTFMIAVNELTVQKCNKRAILEPLLILISPYAPHIAEELWEKLGYTTSVSTAIFPVFEEKYLAENTKIYPIAFNGKMRFTLELPLEMSKAEIEKTVMAYEKTQMQLQGSIPKKVIVVPGKIVNIVG